MKILTKEKFKAMKPCEEGYKWVIKNFPAEKNRPETIVRKLMTDNIEWANWLVVRCLTRKNQLRYTVFAAKLFLKNFEDKFPDDDRPRRAIEATEKVIENDNEETRSAADSAAYSADLAAYSARSAAYSARSAADLARSAAYLAYSAAYSADSAAYSARSAADSAAYSARSAADLARSAADSAADSAYSAADSAADSAAYSADLAADSARSAAYKTIIEYGITLL